MAEKVDYEKEWKKLTSEMEKAGEEIERQHLAAKSEVRFDVKGLSKTNYMDKVVDYIHAYKAAAGNASPSKTVTRSQIMGIIERIAQNQGLTKVQLLQRMEKGGQSLDQIVEQIRGNDQSTHVNQTREGRYHELIKPHDREKQEGIAGIHFKKSGDYGLEKQKYDVIENLQTHIDAYIEHKRQG